MTVVVDGLISRADVMLAEARNGEIRCNLGYRSTGEGIASSVSMWGPAGFISMPDEPSDSGATEALYLQDGNSRYIVGTRDNRIASKTGNPQPGDRMITANCDARLFLKKANNAISLYTSNETDGDSSMIVDVNGKTGVLALINGGSLMTMTKDEIMLTAGGSMIHITSSGVNVYGKHTGLNTAGGNLGVLPIGIPSPVGIGSVLGGPTGLAAAPSTRWTVALAFVLFWSVASVLWSMKT